MKRNVERFAAVALVMGMFVALAPIAQAQGAAQAQKLAVIAKQLNLTPAQKAQLMPILEADAISRLSMHKAIRRSKRS